MSSQRGVAEVVVYKRKMNAPKRARMQANESLRRRKSWRNADLATVGKDHGARNTQSITIFRAPDAKSQSYTPARKGDLHYFSFRN